MQIEREIVLPVPREEAWEALTEPERLEEWFANDVELDAVPGGEGVFEWDNGEVRHAVVESVEELERLVLRWDDEGTVELELVEHPAGTLRARPGDGARVGHRARPARERRVGDGVGAVFAALADPSRRDDRRAARHVRPRDVDRARGRAADDAPGGREASRDARARGARPRAAARAGTTVYRPDPAPLRDATAWIDRVGVEWDERLEALARHVAGREPA